METCPTIRIKSAVEGIEFFVINEADFDPSKHERFDAAEKSAESTEPQPLTAAQLKEALIAKGIAFKGNASKADLQALLDAAEKSAE
ncbi:MAG: hypothetical protein EOP39_04575 [Rubrivivax sp.]|nr:MAG: hypothetical protein EOP39_04575 [Rubrivivax sp.]